VAADVCRPKATGRGSPELEPDGIDGAGRASAESSSFSLVKTFMPTFGEIRDPIACPTQKHF